MNAEEQRDANAVYMRRWREKNPLARHNNNDKINEAKSIQCGCGGCYKDISHLRNRHFATAKHQCWENKREVMSLFIKSGRHCDEDDSSSRIDALCNKQHRYTAKAKIQLYATMKRQLRQSMAQNESEEESEEESEQESEQEEQKERPYNITHAEKVLRVLRETEETEETEEPKNIIIKVNETTPPTPCPTSSEEESEASEESEEESEEGDTEESTSESDSDDPYGDKALEEIKQRLKFV